MDDAVDAGTDAELRALRARAYAPGGDIAADPVARARLAELEAAARAARGAGATAPSAPTAVTTQAAPQPASGGRGLIEGVPAGFADSTPSSSAGVAAASAPDPDAVDAAATDAAGPATDPAVTARACTRFPGRSMLAWAGSLVAVAALAAGATAFATARTASTATTVPDDAAVEHVTTLLSTGTDLPSFFRSYGGSAEGRAFEPFFGLAVWQTDTFFSPDESDDTCLVITRVSDIESATSDSWSGLMNNGCSAGAFPASVTFTVREQQPEELRERYPIGTALQFVLTDAGVDVFVSPAPSRSATAQPAG